MDINTLKNIKNHVEISAINKKIKIFTDEEKEDLNKIINFAVTWWLQYVDSYYCELLTEEQNMQLESFKHNFGMYILKKILLTDKNLVLHCGYKPDGLLRKIIQETKCEFLTEVFPLISTMTINNQQIWIKKGYEDKKSLLLDVKQKIEYENSETCENSQIYENMSEEEKIDDVILKIMKNEIIIPDNFTPSTYDYVSNFINSTNVEKNNQVKKHIR